MIIRRPRPVGEERPRQIIRRKGGVTPPSGSGSRGTRSRLESFLIVAIVALTVVAIGMAGSFVWNSDMMRVSKFSVTGSEHIEADTLSTLSGLQGQRTLTADLATAEQRLETHPLVRQAEVTRSLPGGVRIRITEREPWGTWEQDGVMYTIDREGYVLGSIAPPDGAPVIRSTDAADMMQAGDRVDFQAVETAAQIEELLPERLGEEIADVVYSATEGIRITTSTGRVAILGDASGLEYKLESWIAIEQDADANGIEYEEIDLRYGNHPVLRTKETS